MPEFFMCLFKKVVGKSTQIEPAGDLITFKHDSFKLKSQI